MNKPAYLPDVIDKHAKENPTRVYASFPRSPTSVKDGYTDLTFAGFANAINKVAWWLDEVYPRQAEYDAVIYYGPNDLRWQFLVVAVQKSRRQILLLNPTNSAEADLKLFDDLKGTRVIVDVGHEGRFAAILHQRPSTKVITIPALEHWLQGHAEHYHFKAPESEEEGWRIPAEVTHSSGTTGNPKRIHHPLALFNSYFHQAVSSKAGLLDDELMFDGLENKRLLMPYPMTWGAGIHVPLGIALSFNFIPVLLPALAVQPISAEMLVESLQYANVQAVALLPFHLKEIAKSPGLFQSLAQAKLEMIGYAGASIEPHIADAFADFDRIQPLYGSTDVGVIPTLRAERGTSQYLGFSSHTGCTFEPVEGVGDSVFELVLRREHDPYRMIAFFDEHPDLNVWHSSDLFKPHPTKKGFWLPIGRADDLLKNANLTKFNAHDVESIIERSENVRGAVMGAQGEMRPYLIVELQERDSTSDGQALEMIWPAVQEANGVLSEELRFDKSRIIIASQEKPLPRLGKGTINRRAVKTSFQEEIEALGA